MWKRSFDIKLQVHQYPSDQTYRSILWAVAWKPLHERSGRNSRAGIRQTDPKKTPWPVCINAILSQSWNIKLWGRRSVAISNIFEARNLLHSRDKHIRNTFPLIMLIMSNGIKARLWGERVSYRVFTLILFLRVTVEFSAEILFFKGHWLDGTRDLIICVQMYLCNRNMQYVPLPHLIGVW